VETKTKADALGAKLHGNSLAMWERAQKVLAGGVGHDLRFQLPHPTYVEHAKAARKWDVDGNEYIDYNMGNGAMFLGHANEPILEAIRAVLDRGTHFGTDHPLQIAWAEQIQKMVPNAERVRFVNSGTEATMLALRIARAFTGKDRFIRLEGHFHGWHDAVSSGAALPFEKAGSAGLPSGVEKNAIMLPANDLGVIESTLAADDSIAALILEPSGASWGTIPLLDGYLQGIREITRKHGVLLIFDEVITGFRFAPGGMQEYAGVVPDLATFAKIIAGGQPGGAVTGSADVMRVFDYTGDSERDRTNRVVHFGTFNAAPLSAGAGIACLKQLADGQAHQRAGQLGERIRQGLNDVLARREVAGYAYGSHTEFHVYVEFDAERRRKAQSRADLRTGDARRLKGMPRGFIVALHSGLRLRGAELMSYNGGMTTAAHTVEDIDQTIDMFDDVVAELVQQGTLPRL
jgi:glutamate-1-semialdehyde 2,1-aminomutase